MDAPTIVTVTASGGDVQVIAENIGDRERHPNGATPVPDGMTKHFIVGAQESLRIVYASPPAE